MSAVFSTRTPRRHHRAGGRVRLAATSRAGTELEIEDTAERVAVAASPDPLAADRVMRVFDRVLWQRLDVCDGVIHAVVLGTRHRRPVQLQVAGSSALGLLQAGVPTIVSLGRSQP